MNGLNNGKMQNNKVYVPNIIEKDMTIIIGARCKDGVIMIADKKVVEGTNITSEDKITTLPLNIYVAGAGVREIIDKFNERIPSILEERRSLNFQDMKKENPNTKIEEVPFYFKPYEFLDDCEGLLSNLSQRYIDDAHKFWHSDILVGLIVGNTAELHHLDTLNCLDSKRRGFKCIGSGSPYAEFILKGVWDEELTMKQMAKLSKFIIQEIERLGIDNNVGEGVQIVFIPDLLKDIKELEKDIKKWQEEFSIADFEGIIGKNNKLDGELDAFFSRLKDKIRGKKI